MIQMGVCKAHGVVKPVFEGFFATYHCPSCGDFISPAQGIEAGTAATVKQGAVHESPVAESDAPNPFSTPSLNPGGNEE
jgi:hypothetical protein